MMNRILVCHLFVAGIILVQRSAAVHIDRRATRAEIVGSTRNRAHAMVSGDGLPSGGRVAVVIRGEVFRGEQGPCDDSEFVRQNQEKATNSLISEILDPLQNDLKNEVHVVITDSSNCSFSNELQQTIGVNRVLGMHTFAGITQGQSVQNALSLFEESVASRQLAVEDYDWILMVRHDTVFDQHVSWWSTSNISKLSVAHKCPFDTMQDPFFGWQCVDDQLFAMPGFLWKTFRDVVKSESPNGCFDECGPGVPSTQSLSCHTEGHWCLPPLQKALEPLGSDVGTLGMWLNPYPFSLSKARPEVKEHLRHLKLQAILDDLPSEPGCYLMLPSGCPRMNVTYEIPAWRKDPNLGSLAIVDTFKVTNTLAGCESRKKWYQEWCGVHDVKMHMATR